MTKGKKDLKKEYQQTDLQMGIYQIKNSVNGKIFIGAGENLPGIINSNRFQLKLGNHKNKALQEDWNRYGEDVFIFEILDEIQPNLVENRNNREVLNEQLIIWLENL